MEKLYLDIGNSHYKMAVFRNDKWSIVADGRIDQPNEFTSKMGLIDGEDHLIVSSVRKDMLELLKKIVLPKRVHVIGFHDIPSNRMDYNTPATLGVDRFLVAHAAFQESEKRVIVIDAGSAITIDLMNEEGVYQGGVIIPGIRIQKQSVSDYLPELPQIESVIPDNWPGKSSKECLEWGINGTLTFAITGFINRYKSLGSDVDVYLTGGDSNIIKRILKTDIDFRTRKCLLFDGMRLFAESK